MTQHTPRPWIYDSGAVYAENGRGRIALADRDNPRTKPVERDANARLIAAAPAMLELIRALLTQWEDQVIRNPLLSQARALLAKVEG